MLQTKQKVLANAIIALSFYSTICNAFLFGKNNFRVEEVVSTTSLLFRTQQSSRCDWKSSRELVRKCSYCCAAHSIQNNEEVMVPTTVVCTATVDYSAVNEYVRAHYNQSQYFDNDRIEHQFHNGRILQSYYENEREMLSENGLAIIKSPLSNDSIEWSQVEDIESSYLPELERIMHNLFPPPSKLMSYCFWNPMMRGEDYEISRAGGGDGNSSMKTPTANIASMVHIDTDVGAFDIHDFLDIVEKNKVQRSPHISSEASTHQYNFRNVADAILNKNKRFAIVNFWRNIGDTPVASAPLAILSTRYDNKQKHQHTPQQPFAFPNARPNMDKSKWYVFPNATREEVIVFYQYDRNVMQPSDLFHCAISAETREEESTLQPRRSFDIRALIVLDESVPGELDRFSLDRTRPVLTFEESGCFCDEQADKIIQKEG